MTASGMSPGPSPRQPAVRLPRALWRAGFRRCALAECIKMLFSQVFSDLPIFKSSFKILTELEVLLLWCDITLMQVGYKGLNPAFTLGTVVDTLRDFIAASILFSLCMKEKVILIDCKWTFGYLQMSSSPIFPELHVWLANDGEWYCTQPPSTVGSSGLSKAVSWHGSTKSSIHRTATSPIHKRGFLCSECTSTLWLG